MTAVDWSMVLVTRTDPTPILTLTAGDLPEDSPVIGSECQDSMEVGTGTLKLPLSWPDLAEMVENRVLLVQSSGETVMACVIGKTDDVVLADDVTAEVATVELLSALDVLNDGIVHPPRGYNVRPRGDDRHWDWSDPARDNSDATTPASFGTVTDVNATPYPVVPYFGNCSHPDSVEVLGPAVGGPYAIDDDAPAGTMFGAEDAVQSADSDDSPGDPLPAGTYKFKGAADNWLETLRFDGTELQGYTFGFVDGWETQPFEYSGGTPRISAAWTNQTGTGRGPCTVALELIKLDGGGGEGPDSQLIWYTTDSFKVWEFPAHAPGMNEGEIALRFLAENVLFDAMTDVTANFDETVDSNGNDWPDQWDVSTKARTKGGVFWLQERAKYSESRFRYDEGSGGWIWDLYSAGGLGTVVAYDTIDPDIVASLTITRERTAATSLAYATPDLFLLYEATPGAGQPVKIAGLDVQAVGSATEGARLAADEAGDFARTREKIAITDKLTDGRDYWRGDSIDNVPASRDLSYTGGRVVSMTWRVDENGELEFTPEFGDLIVPVVARPSVALAKMAGPSLHGRARTATRG